MVKSKIFTVKGSFYGDTMDTADRLFNELENKINCWLAENGAIIKILQSSYSITHAGKDVASCIIVYKEKLVKVTPEEIIKGV